MPHILLPVSFVSVLLSSPMIEKKNDVPKYLRGIQLEEICDEVYDEEKVCYRENGKYVTQYCRFIYRKSRGSSPRYRYGFCENGNLICCT